MSILERIHSQPQRTREIMFGLSVVITVFLVGAIWFHDFQGDIYALMNPEQVQEERYLAKQNEQSLFGALSKTFGDIGSSVTEFLGSASKTTEVKTGVENQSSDKVYLLPLSEDR